MKLVDVVINDGWNNVYNDNDEEVTAIILEIVIITKIIILTMKIIMIIMRIIMMW